MIRQEEITNSITNSIKERFGHKRFYPVEPGYSIKPGYRLEWTASENRCGSGGSRIWRLLDESGNWVAAGETCACGRGCSGLDTIVSCAWDIEPELDTVRV